MLPGDLVFIVRSEGQVEALRSGQHLVPSSSGVVYAIQGDAFQYIAGNIGNAVRLRDLNLADPKIAGFARIGTSAGATLGADNLE